MMTMNSNHLGQSHEFRHYLDKKLHSLAAKLFNHLVDTGDIATRMGEASNDVSYVSAPTKELNAI
jgi:hypothetical protein